MEPLYGPLYVIVNGEQSQLSINYVHVLIQLKPLMSLINYV